MNLTISHGGDASYKVNNGKAANQIAKSNQGITHTYDYMRNPERGIKTRWVNGKIDATFQCDIEALPDLLTNLVSEFWKEKYNCSLQNEDYSQAVTDWVEWADEGYLQREPIALKWLRTSLDSGEIYCLTVPADAAVCENCDIVLGNYTGVEIFEAFRNKFKNEFEQHGLSELVATKYDGSYMRWDIRTAFLAGVISAIARFDAIDLVVYEAPENEWTTFCEHWNELVQCKSEGNCPWPNDETIWNIIYDRLSN